MLSAGTKWNTARFSSYYRHKAYYGRFVRPIETVFILNRLMSIVTGTKRRNANISFYLLCLFAISETYQGKKILQTWHFPLCVFNLICKGKLEKQFIINPRDCFYALRCHRSRKCLKPQSPLSKATPFSTRQFTKLPEEKVHSQKPATDLSHWDMCVLVRARKDT